MSNDKESTAKKAGKSFGSMWKRLFTGNKPERSVLEEEALRTPGKTILINLLHNKLAITGFTVFVGVLLFVFIGAALNPIVENYTELTNSNLKPSTNFLKYPASLADKNIVKIVSGVSFSVALDDKGDLTIWGTECNIELPGVADYIMNIPESIRNANIIDIESGGYHVIATDDRGYFYAWGNYSNGQTRIPNEIHMEMQNDSFKSIAQMSAMTRWSSILGDNGYVYLWGSMQAEQSFVQLYAAPRADQMAAGDNHVVLLHRDGTVSVVGQAGTEVMEKVPPELQNGSVRVVQVASSNRNALALDDTGKLWCWGSAEYKLDEVPEISGKIISMDGAYKNFIVATDEGEVVVWGSNELKQLEVPKNLQGKGTGAANVYGDYFQLYATDANGRILGAWGNRGYLWGSDHLGRDMFSRTIHGGMISLTVGVIAVIIATFIAVVLGLTAGYFGGWVDQALMRLADIFNAVPFLPVVITLSYVIGHRISNTAKVYLLMILLGVLGWMGLARLIRAQLLLEREKDFVLAARALGVKQGGIMFRHIFPNVTSYVIVDITLTYAVMILQEAVFSFLGFGVQEPSPSWGNMLTSAQESVVLKYYWWRWVIPALFVVIAAFSINLIGDGLRDAMDPKASER